MDRSTASVLSTLFVVLTIIFLCKEETLPSQVEHYLSLPEEVIANMERLNLDYSYKNIPLPSHNEYRKVLLEKVESVIKRMRWKAFFFLKKNETDNELDDDITKQSCKFGFKSRKSPPLIPEMQNFENDMLKMVENVEFRRYCNQFQSSLKEDLRKINATNKILVPADKTRNIYCLNHEDYDKILTENITSTYKHAEQTLIDEINTEFNELSTKLKISDRINSTQKRTAYITLKDHKDNFDNNPKCRLINPTKSEIGKVSKYILDSVNNTIRSKINVNQWRNTNSVLDWFKMLEKKDELTFLVFDIVDFYPSISEDLLSKTLSWASQYAQISELDKQTILHARKSLLYDTKGKSWVKKNSRKAFDVTMGGYDGAEICELVGLFLLNHLNQHIDADSLGLYRDDGLTTLRKKSKSETERIRKQIIDIFKSFGLKITVKTNLKSVDFLDTHLNLHTGIYQPYRKPNNDPLYINAQSNHPPSIIKHITSAVEKRISLLSTNKDVFEKAAPAYNKALHNSGFLQNITYNVQNRNSNSTNRSRNRQRNIIWFNPPFSLNVKSNIGRIFLKLLEKHFPKQNKLHKIFNRNNVKISYSCMKNISNIIKTHNAKIIKKELSEKEEKTCNCRITTNCPLQGNCLQKAVVYKASVETNNNKVTYIGLAGGTFKQRFNNHMKSFKNEIYKNETELSKYIWNLKNNKQQFSVSWEIIKTSNTNIRESGQCNLCITEKLQILLTKDNINKRTEFLSKCRHNNK